MMGFSHDTFYRYQAARDAGGVEALFEVSRRKPNLKNRVEEAIEVAVTAFAIDFPAYGQTRASNELRKQGVFVSPSGVRSIWMRHDLASMKQRLRALEKLSYVGTIKGVGRIYQQTFVDTYSKWAAAKLHTTKAPITGVDLLNDRVLPFFSSMNMGLIRMLTDRGTEFSNPFIFEKDNEGNTRTNIFYCEPYRSNQKGMIERNHEFIRYIIPSGYSFDRYEQDDIDLMMMHINNYPRNSLNGATPYELAKAILGQDILRKLHMHKIDADHVILKPFLLRDRKRKDS